MRLPLPLLAAILAAAPLSPLSAESPPGIAETIAMPVASGLTGANARRRFAWVENRAGARSIWWTDAGGTPHQLGRQTGDPGVELSDLTFSADGERIAYVSGGDPEFPEATDPNPAAFPEAPLQIVHLALLRGDGTAGDLALGEGHGPSFSPTGDRIAFTHEGRLFLARADGGGGTMLAEMRGDIGPLRWSPDGGRLLFTVDRDDHSLTGLFDLASGTLRYLDPGLGHDVEPVFSPDGTHVAFIRYASPPPGADAGSGPYWSLHVVDLATGTGRDIWSAPAGPGARYNGTRSRNLFWSADDRLIFPWERDGWIHAYAIPAGGGTPAPLTPGAFEVESFLLDSTGRALVYAANAGDIDRRHIWRTPLTGGGARQLTQGPGIESAPTLAADAMGVIATDVRTPAHPALVGDGGLTPLAGRKADYRPAAGFVAPEQVVFRAEDGVEIHGQLFRAHGDDARRARPALVFIHGGPHRQMLLGFHPSGYYSNAYAMNQHLAAEGYTILAVNYRGGTGYGLAFRDAEGTGRAGASEYRDIVAAGHYLARLPGVDARHIGLWGGSWGGYLTALGLARNSDLFAAGTDLHGVHDMLRPDQPGLSPAQAATVHAQEWASSPIAAIATWRSPVLLIHGDDDRNVSFTQSVLLARMLKARRIPYEERMFAGERHGFIRYADWRAAYEAMDDFFRRTLATEAAK